jgi:hypothetical protein
VVCDEAVTVTAYVPSLEPWVPKDAPGFWKPDGASDQASGRSGQPAGGSRSQTIGPIGVGVEWLTGKGPQKRTFKDGDKFTELLKEHPHVERVREQVCTGALPPVGAQPYELHGLEGVPKYVRDYSTILTFGATGNFAVTYLGSYNLKYAVSGGGVEFHVDNYSTIASAFRPPIIGYWPWWQQNVAPRVNGGREARESDVSVED